MIPTLILYAYLLHHSEHFHEANALYKVSFPIPLKTSQNSSYGVTIKG